MGEHTLMGSNVHFATREEGRAKIAIPDVYSNRLSPYELKAKIRTMSHVTSDDYLQNCRKFVRSWTSAEVSYLGSMIRWVDERIAALGLNFRLPEDILLIKTTGWEEGGANGYTRENAIYLKQYSLSLHLLIHELFHVVARTNPERATNAYNLLGFEEVEEIQYDDLLKISNPDAPFLRHAVAVTHQGVPIKVCLVMRGSGAYYGGGFFSYVQKKLLVLEEREGRWQPGVTDRQLQFLDYHEVQGLYQQIGRNTGYNIHQEEVTAEHFEFLLSGRTGLPNLPLVEGLQRVLS
jgi:hypothetical protein